MKDKGGICHRVSVDVKQFDTTQLIFPAKRSLITSEGGPYVLIKVAGSYQCKRDGQVCRGTRPVVLIAPLYLTGLFTKGVPI